MDLSRSEDRRLLAEALRRNWRPVADRLPTYLAQLDHVIRTADPSDRSGAQAITQACRILDSLVGRAMTDLHRAEDHARMDEGKPTMVVGAAKAPIDHDEFRRRVIGEMTAEN